MTGPLLLFGVVIVICVLLNTIIDKLPIPSLLIFIALGMIFGENGLFRIQFDNYSLVNTVCSVCLIFIMFYSGFGTNIHAAKPVLAPALLMSSLGVVGTTFGVAFFVNRIFQLPFLESFLIGAVVSSTDAASVFNILRSKKLALKYHTDSLLEVESGSNDPMSYLLTTVAVTLLSGKSVSVPLLLAQQLLIGGLCGLLIGFLAVRLLHMRLLPSEQSHTVFLFAIMILAYAIPMIFNGNGYLSVYISGIIIGSSSISQKKYLIHFFDVLTDVAQMIIFFLLGLLVTPVDLPAVIVPALIIMAVLTFVVRPGVSALILLPMRAKISQFALVSWSGLRGAASIVFAISAVLVRIHTTWNLFNLVFCIVLLSILIQGTLLPLVAKKLDMVDPSGDISRTFNDYQEESDIAFVRVQVPEDSSWPGKKLAQIAFPKDMIVALMIRSQEAVVPTGDTEIEAGDLLILAARSFQGQDRIKLVEKVVERGGQLANHALADVSLGDQNRIILIKRGDQTVIPVGSTVLKAGDILVQAEVEEG